MCTEGAAMGQDAMGRVQLAVKRLVGKVSGRQRSESPSTWVLGQVPVVE